LRAKPKQAGKKEGGWGEGIFARLLPFPFRLRKGKAEGGFGRNSAFPLRNQNEDSPATCLNTWKAGHHRKILFSLGERKIRRAQNEKSKEYFSVAWRAERAVAGLASSLGVLRKMGSDFFKQTPPQFGKHLNIKESTMSDYFFIDRENMPCIYELSFDFGIPAIIVRIHKEFMDRWPKLLEEAPIVVALMQQFGFSTFKSGYKGDFGFDSAFERTADEDDFAVFSAQIPVVQKVAEKICPFCSGDKRSLFGACLNCNRRGKLDEVCPECLGKKEDESGFDCLHCGGKGKKTYFDWKPAFAVSASFTLFFHLASFKMAREEATSCHSPQLILVNTMTEHNSHGGSLDGTYSIPLAKWLSSFEPNTEKKEMTQAMIRAWEKMFGKVDGYDRHSFYAKVAYKNGWLNVSCHGDRCGLHPENSWGPESGRGYKFSCHNVDTPAQQITLLAGLAALCDRAKKEINTC